MKLLILALFTVLSLTACGKDRCIGQTFNGNNNAGLIGTFTPSRSDAKWVIGTITLTNVGTKPIQFTALQAGNTYPGFKISFPGAPEVSAVQDVRVNPWIGTVTVVNGAQISELPVGANVSLPMKWSVLGKPAKNSSFTVRVTGMASEGKAIPDLLITNPGM